MDARAGSKRLRSSDGYNRRMSALALRSRPDRIVVRRATWAEYERILAKRGEGRSPRIAYLEGRIELMSPSAPHEGIAWTIGRLLEAWCDVHGIDLAGFGNWTVRRKSMKSGAEPDACFVFHGEDPYAARRPDLVIEVIWTSGGLDKLEIWRKLGIPEVWVWQDGVLTAYVKRGDRFIPTRESRMLPGIDFEQLASFVRRPGMPTRAIRAYRAALIRSRRRKH